MVTSARSKTSISKKTGGPSGIFVDTGKWFSGKRVLISPMSVPDGWGETVFA